MYHHLCRSLQCFLVGFPDTTLESSIYLGKLLEQSLAEIIVVNVD